MLMLLLKVVAANSADEIMNSPEKKPMTPVINARPVKMSLYKVFML